MAVFKITGQQPLGGTIRVNGSKNAATPIIAATLLTHATCVLRNVPRIEDVHRLLELIGSVGARYEWIDEHTLQVRTEHVEVSALDVATVRRLRSSVLLMGALLGRCGSITIPGPGGDQIGARPLDAHLDALQELGVAVDRHDDLYTLTQGARTDADITLSEFSVTATENVVLASVLAKDRTTIVRCAAADPSVQDLCWFLNSSGARIDGVGSHTLTIRGVERFHEVEYDIMPDPVEAGTFICLAAASRSEMTIQNVPTSFMLSEMRKFKDVNVNLELATPTTYPGGFYAVTDVVIRRSTQLRSVRNVHNMPFPGFSADLLQPFSVLLTQCSGTSLVHDWMYEGRLKYVEELNKMGAQIFIADPHRILINGPTNLYAADITSYDIRTGASLFIASLIASGESTIGPAYQVDRGYERFDERLRSLGARIDRIDR